MAIMMDFRGTKSEHNKLRNYSLAPSDPGQYVTFAPQNATVREQGAKNVP
jgi:hypothetical protein